MQLFRDAFTSLEFDELQDFGNLRLTPVFIDEAMPPEETGNMTDQFVPIQKIIKECVVDPFKRHLINF